MASTTFVDGETLIEASWLNAVNAVVYTPGTLMAADIANVPAGNIASTRVQAALNELDTEKQPLNAQLTTLAGITAQQATDLAAVSTFMGTVLNDADAATVRATLGAAPATTYIESDLAAASKIALTSATAANITSISLSAGEWDVSGVVVFDPAATTSVTVKRGSISLTSAAIDPTLGRFFGHSGAASVDAGNASSYASKIVRLSLGATTTVYLVASSTFTVDAMSAYGNISARKVA